MKSKPPKRPKSKVTTQRNPIAQFVDLDRRVAALEAAVFPKPDSGPSFGARLESLEQRLADLSKDLELRASTLDNKYSRKIREIIEIVAELRELVEKFGTGQKFKTMEA